MIPFFSALVLIAVAADTSSTAARIVLALLALAFAVAGLVGYLARKVRPW